MKQATYTVTVEVADQDEDLLYWGVQSAIKGRFDGTGIHVRSVTMEEGTTT